MFSIGEISVRSDAMLAPMAGITDRPFRELALRFGAGMVVSEMIASKEVVEAKPSTLAKAELAVGAERSAVQIAGRDAYWMAEAAKLVEAEGAGLIDINMGCPAKKVTSGASGSALMRSPKLAVSLVRSVVSSVSVPVTVKMRLGWDDDHQNAAEIALGAVNEGAQAIMVHGRTRCQFYKGAADWRAIRPVSEAVDVPVIANGDIVDAHSARAALSQSNARAVMVGRAARGAPWVPGQIGAALEGKTHSQPPGGNALSDLISEHYEMQLSFYGRELGVRTARKHLGWYLDKIPLTADLRAKLLREESASNVLKMIRCELPCLLADLREAA